MNTVRFEKDDVDSLMRPGARPQIKSGGPHSRLYPTTNALAPERAPGDWVVCVDYTDTKGQLVHAELSLVDMREWCKRLGCR